MSWWSPTNPRARWPWLTSQPVAHSLGGVVFSLVGMLLWWPHGGWHPVGFAGFMAAFWQLLSVEWEPDSVYQLRWAAYDVLTALVAATVVVLIRGRV